MINFNYIFMAYEGTSIATMSKRIIDLDTIKHITPYKYSFHTCEEIPAIRIQYKNNNTM